MTIYLDRYRALKHKAIVDRQLYLLKYNNPLKPYQLLQGCPMIINVDGTYVELNKLPMICERKYGGTVNDYVMAVRRNDPTINVTFRWRR